jgi:hypothetical protein
MYRRFCNGAGRDRRVGVVVGRKACLALTGWEVECAMDRLELLKQLSFGSRVAEEEVARLQDYFVRTDQWNRIVRGDIDIVRGEKGAGKSALYLLLDKNKSDFFDRNVFLVSAENPRGTTVFKDLVSDPPTSEAEFVVLWKLYLLTIICHEIRGFGMTSSGINQVYAALEEAGLLERELNLAGLLRAAQSFARRLLTIKSLEAGVELDSTTGLPSGIIGKISIAEPNGELRSKGISSLDGLFEKVNSGLTENGYEIWALLDRLDVAFAESHELEANAILALLKVYADFRSLEKISLKIFIREDIWKRVVSAGMREASHITRYETMKWTSPMLLHLAMRRILSNDILIEHMKLDRDEVLASADLQKELFYRIFPDQVEQGEKRSTTFDWMVTRCADATGNTAPREMIDLLNSIKIEEIRRLEIGETAAPDDQLFDRSVFKLALPTVSQTRLNTYLYAEYSSEKPFIEKLRREKTEQTIENLSALWELDAVETSRKAQDLVTLGFFQKRGNRLDPTYWVPFLYRDALELVQGKAGSQGPSSELDE